MASTLKINTLTGVTTAGSIAVTGEGNSTTTNLQQGLCKAWVNFDGTASGAAARDSFNVSGMTDNGTGDHTITINNDFGNANYSAVGCCIAGTGSGNNGQVVSSIGSGSNAPAGSIRIAVQYSSNQSKNDVDGVSVHFCGDLA
tara:strand:- start:15 stop:443 length:429 start_codon:yes stop_codon:yes gene_type:complete